jgi:hypothetical protein
MKNRSFIYALIIVTILLGGWAATVLKMETDVSAYNLASRKDINHYNSFVESFKKDSGQYSIIVLEKEGGWNTQEDFYLLQEMTDFWDHEPEISSATSIVTIDYPRKGIILSRFGPFLEVNNQRSLKKRLDNYDLYKDVFQKFLSKDRKYALIFLETAVGIAPASALKFQQQNNQVKGVAVHYLQYNLIQKELESYLRKDTIILGGISLLLILAGFYLFTHSLRGLGLITLMVMFNISATFIVMYALNMSFSLHMITVPCIIIVLSFTDIMHILYYQKDLRSQCTTDKDLQTSIIAKVQMPLLLTSLTNIAGFIMFLLLADNVHLFNYALVSILGVIFAYLSSRFMVIRLMDREIVYLRRVPFQILYTAHRALFQWLSMRKYWVFGTFLIANVAVITYVVSTFQIDHPDKDFSIENAALESGKNITETHFFGSKRAEIFIHLKNGKVWDKPILNQIERIENDIEALFQPLYINSPALIVRRYQRYLSNGRPKALYVPKVLGRPYKAELQQHYASLGGADIINEEGNTARIVFGFPNADLTQLREQYARLRQRLESENNSSAYFELSGLQYLSDEATHSFSHKILIGFGVSILFSSFIILLLMRSVSISVGLLLVNLSPVFTALGLIILLGISITPLTLFLLSILLGVCVDDSIYLVMQKRLSSAKVHVLPVFITSLVLSLGFLSLSFSAFEWLQPFGWIFLLGIVMAYFLDVFVLTLWLGKEVECME